MLMTLYRGQRGHDFQKECMTLTCSDFMLHFRPTRTTFEMLHCWLKGSLINPLSQTQIFQYGLPPRIWNFLLSNLENAYENLVKEFYANAIVEGEEIKCLIVIIFNPLYLVFIVGFDCKGCVLERERESMKTQATEARRVLVGIARLSFPRSEACALHMIGM